MPGERDLENEETISVRQSVAACRELRVLLAADAPPGADRVETALREAGYRPICERVRHADSMREALGRGGFDVIIAMGSDGTFDSAAALEVFRESERDVPFLIVGGATDEETVIRALKRGAQDYIAANDVERLAPAVEREIAEAEARRFRRSAERAESEEASVAAALARVSRELIGALDTPRLLDTLCRVSAEVLGCDTSHTMLHEPGEDVFVPIASHGETPEEREVGRVVKVPRAVMAALLERIEQKDVAEVRHLPEHLASARRAAVQMCMALRSRGKVVGVQVASRREGDARFSRLERRVAAGVARLGSLALDHARVLEELERASHIKSEFVASVSHELRTPLSVVIGYTDLLIDGAFGDLNSEQVEVLRRISARGRGLLELINATLDLGHIEAGRLDLEIGDVDVNELLGSLAAEATEGHAKPDVELYWEVDPGATRLRTDGAKLEVILKNLIGNALKFTERGQVAVHARRADGWFHFDVSDTGVGIPEPALAIVFEPFRQVDSSSTRKHGGVGLGLYIVRRLVEIIGGTIHVESQVGEGSHFRVSVPEK